MSAEVAYCFLKNVNQFCKLSKSFVANAFLFQINNCGVACLHSTVCADSLELKNVLHVVDELASYWVVH